MQMFGKMVQLEPVYCNCDFLNFDNGKGKSEDEAYFKLFKILKSAKIPVEIAKRKNTW
jgi:hypothetical protein